MAIAKQVDVGRSDLVDPKDESPDPTSLGPNLLSFDRAKSSQNAASPARTAFAPDNSLNPGLSLDRIGQALAAFYDDLVAEGVPEHLASLIRQARPAEAAPVAEAEDAIVGAALAKAGRIAIIVEDDAATRTLAESLFEATELEAVGCDSAEGALDILRSRGTNVALVFADVHLAGEMDGLQLANAVATLWPRTRMVLTSGRTLMKPSDLPAQVVFIPKPWRPAAVLVEAGLATSETPPVVP